MNKKTKLLVIGLVAFAFIIGALLGIIGYNGGVYSGKLFGIESKIKNEPSVKKAIEIQQAFRLVAKTVLPAVVNISAEHVVKVPVFNFPPEFSDPFFQFFFGEPEREYIQKSLGSGVIVNEDGYILSNYHVVKNATRIRVKLRNKKSYKAKIVGVDPKTDLAVIKIKANHLPVAPLGDSDKIEIGDWAIAIGNPFGLSHTFTVGVISAKGRSGIFPGSSRYEDFIQTDAPINPGNSGGPLVNIQGEVIGINTAIASPSGGNVGIGFAVPINMAKYVMKQIIEKGKVVRGWLGVTIQDLTEEIAKHFNREPYSGVLIAQVIKKSPAHKAGLKTGDIIIKYNGKKITSVNQLRTLVAETEPGTKVKITIIRNGKKKTVKVKIEEMPEEEEIVKRGVEKPEKWLGMSVDNITPVTARKYRIEEDQEGVVITGVDPNSPAAAAGIMVGDVIKKINDFRIKNKADYEEFVNKYGSENSFLFLIDRKGELFFIAIETE